MSRKTVFNFFLCLLIFCLPTHFFLKFAVEDSYVRGLLIDYVLPKLYLSDLLALAVIVTGWPALHFKLNRAWVVFGGLSLVLAGAQLLSGFPVAGLVMLARLLGAILLTGVLMANRSQLKPTWLISSLIATILFQSGLGIWQFVTQKSFWGYALLGEPNIRSFAGLAKASFWGVEKTLPYGTTAHPNVLAGVLAVYLSLSLVGINAIKDSQKWLQIAWGVALVVGAMTLGLTQSLSGWLALSIGLTLVTAHYRSFKPSISYRLLPICCLILTPIFISLGSWWLPDNQSLYRRHYLNLNAIQLWQSQPLPGVGLAQNAAAGEALSAVKETVRFAQPTHYLPLLWLSETGVVGVAWILSVGWAAKKSLQPSFKALWWLMLVPLAALDHYLLTSNAGLLLMGLIVSSVFSPATFED